MGAAHIRAVKPDREGSDWQQLSTCYCRSFQALIHEVTLLGAVDPVSTVALAQ